MPKKKDVPNPVWRCTAPPVQEFAFGPLGNALHPNCSFTGQGVVFGMLVFTQSDLWHVAHANTHTHTRTRYKTNFTLNTHNNALMDGTQERWCVFFFSLLCATSSSLTCGGPKTRSDVGVRIRYTVGGKRNNLANNQPNYPRFVHIHEYAHGLYVHWHTVTPRGRQVWELVHDLMHFLCHPLAAALPLPSFLPQECVFGLVEKTEPLSSQEQIQIHLSRDQGTSRPKRWPHHKHTHGFPSS